MDCKRQGDRGLGSRMSNRGKEKKNTAGEEGVKKLNRFCRRAKDKCRQMSDLVSPKEGELLQRVLQEKEQSKESRK
eukprot:8935944-Ditylum_brightwellii.AAC.1